LHMSYEEVILEYQSCAIHKQSKCMTMSRLRSRVA